MAGEEVEGYTKVVQKEYNKAFHEFQDARISNANVRFSTKHVVTAQEAGAYGAILTTITIPDGQQLRLIYLNFWSKDPENPGQLVIAQTGGTSHALPDGQVDAIMVPPVGSPGKNPHVMLGTSKDPIHILEGTVTFTLQNPTAGVEYGLSFWGDQNSPQIDP
ncbi:hypothetical protein ES702_04244 [subsurface metagenome]